MLMIMVYAFWFWICLENIVPLADNIRSKTLYSDQMHMNISN